MLFVSGYTMTAFYIILASLILHPIVGYFIIRVTKDNIKTRKKILLGFFTSSLIIILGYFFHIITISQRLNWLLLTSIYLTVSTLLWATQFQTKHIIKIPGIFLTSIVFGIGYFVSTFGILFTLIAALDLDTDQRIWLTKDLIYKERNIGQGPDPSIREKQIEVYKTISFFPLLAKRVKEKTYDTWDLPLQKDLNISFSKEKNTLYLTSLIKGYKTFNWCDSISFSKLYIR
jgi:hypothetical protein